MIKTSIIEVSSSDLRAELARWDNVSVHREVDQIPRGWFDCVQLADHWSITSNSARVRLRSFIKAGVAEARGFRKVVGNRVCPVLHYKLKK